jgi:alpha-tubulin suppressor-like RCC1 family protein
MHTITKQPSTRVLFYFLSLAPLACSSNSTEPAPVAVATQLAFTAQPSNVVAGASISPTLQVTARDASGNIVTSFTGSVSIAIDSNPGGGTLAGTTTVTAETGVVSFSTLSIGTVGTGYTLTASATGLTSATSAAFDVMAGAATQLAFTVEPSDVAAGASISPTLEITARDAAGNTATGFTGNVTIAIGTNPVGGTLSGTTTAAATAGVASFASLSIDNAGSGYTLTASSSLTSATSATFDVTGPLAFASVAAGESHTCALTSGGVAYCWGLNTDGQLGDNSTTNRNTPAPVSGGLTFSGLSVGVLHTCGLTTGGTAYCWGRDQYGQLGDGTPGDAQRVPGAVSGGLSFTELTAGANHTCGLRSNGTAYCWGDNSYGVLGDSTQIDRPVPTTVFGGITFTTLSAGTGDQTCGLASNGAAYCWGRNNFGALGDSTTATQRWAPTAVAGGLTFVDVSTGYSQTCGLASSGEAYCWGLNSNGQLGDGSRTNRRYPSRVSGELTFASVQTGHARFSAMACGVVTSGLASNRIAYCWGSNPNGQLGDGSNTSRTAPTAVAGGLTFGAVSPGGTHTCGRASDGLAYCWGLNTYGQLGDATATNRVTPTRVQR